MSLFIRLWRVLMSLFGREERALPARMRMSTPLGVRRLEERRVLNADLASALLPAPVVDLGSTESAPVDPAVHAEQSAASEVVFIDSRVSDWQTLAAGVRDGVAVHVLDQRTDGLTQIADYLQDHASTQHSPLTALHIVSHGESGSLLLGAGEITAGELSAFSVQLSAIGASLSADGDILLYGCNVGEGATGGEFLQTLSTLTKADVAASTDLTGAEFLGGDWVLEAEQGVVETGVAFALQTQVDYAGVLPSSAVAVTVDVGGLIDLNIVDSGANNDDLTVSYDSGTSSFVFTSAAGTINGSSSHSVLASTITGGDIFVNTFGGDDSLTIQSSAIDALASLGIKITYNGGAQATAAGDELNVTGGTYTTFQYDVTGSGAGGLAFNGYSAISFTGLEPVTVTSLAGTVIVDVDPAGTVAGPRTVAVSDAGGGNLLIDLDGTLEDLTITAPTVELQILGDSDSDDTITVASLPSSFAALTINGRGGAADAVSLNGDITFGAGNSLNVTAESITTGANADLMTSGAGTITLTGDDVAIDATSTLSSASIVTLQQQTNGREIDLGSETTGKLSLTDAELDRITAGTIVVGNAAAGSILVTQVINPAGTSHLSLHTGGGIFDGHPSTELVVANLTLTAARIGNGLGNEVDTNTTGLLSLTTTGSGAAGDIALFSETNLSTNTSRLTVATAASAQTVILNTLGTFTVDGNFGNLTDSLHLTARGNSGGVGFLQSGGTLTGAGIGLMTSGLSAGGIGTSANPISVSTAGLNTDTSAANGHQFLSGTATIGSAGGLNAGSGTIEFQNGTFTLSTANLVNDGSSVRVNGATATFDIGAFDDTVNQVTLVDGSIVGSTGRLVSYNGFAVENGQISARLQGGALTKSTSGTVTLTGDNSNLSGPVAVQAGSLIVNGALAGGVTVQSGGTLAGTGPIAGAVVIQSGGQHSPGNSPGIQNTGDYTLNVGGTLNLEVEGVTTAGGAGGYDQVNVTGTVTLGGTLNLIDSFAGSGALGNTLILIANDLADAVNGTFNSLLNGANITFNGETWRIFYDGGDGNDVVLTFVPASLPVVYVEDNFIAANGFHNGNVIADASGKLAGSQLAVVGVNAFASIISGIAAVDVSGTVHVEAGTYNEFITVNKSVSLLGANSGVHPAIGTSPTAILGVRSAESIMTHAPASSFYSFAPQANDITIDGFRFEGPGSRAIDSGSGTANNLHITNNIFANTATTSGTGVIQLADGTYTDLRIDFNQFVHTGAGNSIQAGGSTGNFDDLLVANNEFAGTASSFFWGASYDLTDATFLENEFDGTNNGNTALNIGNASNLTIQDNHFHDLRSTAFLVGTNGGLISGNTIERIRAIGGTAAHLFSLFGGQTFGGPPTTVSTNVDIANNFFSYNDVVGGTAASHGVRLLPTTFGSPTPASFTGLIDGSTIHINENSFVDGGQRSDALAIRNFANPATTLDASLNWWDTTDQSTIHQQTGGLEPALNIFDLSPVDFTSYLHVGTDTDLVTAGFQGSFAALHVTSLGGQTGSVGRIQEAIDAVDVGGEIIIEAAPGPATATYAESATVNKNNLLIRGSTGTASQVVIDPTAGDGIAITSAVTNVTIRDLRVTDAPEDGIDADGVSGLLTFTNVESLNNGGDGFDLRNVGHVVATSVVATGNDPGMLINGALSFSDSNGNYFNNDDHGIQLIDISGNVTLVRTTLENNDADNSGVGDGLNATDGADGDNLAIGGSLLVQGATIRSVTPGTTHQERGVFVERIAGAVTFEDATGPAQSNTITGHDQEGVYIADGGTTATFTNGSFSNNGADGLRLSSFSGAVLLDGVTVQSNAGNGFDVSNSPSLTITNVTSAGNIAGDLVAAVATVTLNTTTAAATTVDTVDVNTAGIGGVGNFRHTRGASVQNIVTFSGVTTLNVNTFAGGDTVNVAAHATTAINLDGGDPTTLVGGDTVNFLTASPTITPSGAGFNVTTSGNQTVFHQNFENASYTGAIVFNGTTGDDTLTLTASDADTATYVLTSSGVAVLSGTIDMVTSLTFNGLSGDDRLVVINPTVGLFDPGSGIFFHGGTGGEGTLGFNPTGDALVLQDGTATTIEHVFTNNNDGFVFYNGEGTATVTYTGLEPIDDSIDAANRVFSFNGGAETITVTDPGTAGRTTIDSTLGESVTFDNPTTSLTINAGSGDDTVNITSVGAAYNAALTINGGGQADTVNLNSSLTLGSNAAGNTGNLIVNAHTISVGAAAAISTTAATGTTDGVGDVLLTATRNIVMNAGSSIATDGGNVTFLANTGAISGDFVGVDLNDADITVSGTGTIDIQGRGGDAATNNQIGVRLSNSATISGGTTNSVTVTGFGGTNATGSGNAGVSVTGTGSQITSAGGAVIVEGLGGGTGATSAGNHGVLVGLAGEISADGTGTVTVTGTGGTNAGGSVNLGVWVTDSGSKITSAGGNITVTGQGGGTGATSNLNSGVRVTQLGEISAGGTGTVTVDGTGGTNAGGHFNFGVEVAVTGSKITSAGGNVTVTGQGGGTGMSAGNEGVRVASGEISAGGTGTVTVTGTGGITAGGIGNIGVSVGGSGAIITSAGGNVTVDGQGGGTGAASSINEGVRVTGTGEISAGGTGTVTVTGTGGTSAGGSNNHGVSVSGTDSKISSSGGAVNVTGQGGGSGGASVNNHGVSVQDGGTIAGNGANPVTVTGLAGVNTTEDVLVDASTSAIQSDTGTITITGLRNNVVMSNGGRVLSNSGNATIRAAGDVRLGTVNLDDDATGPAGTAIITADFNTASVDMTNGVASDGVGAIIDNLTGEAANITAAAIALRAGSGIGTDADDINTAKATGLATLTLAAQTDSGDIHIRNSGSLTIGSVNGLNGAYITDDSLLGVDAQDSGADNIRIIASSPLTVVQTVVNQDGGNITLAAEGTAVTDDLTINADITAVGGNGNISLYAGHDVILQGTTAVFAESAGAVLLAAGENFNNGTPVAGNADSDVTMGANTTVTSVNGAVTLRATTNVIVTGVSAGTTATITADSDSSNVGAIIDAGDVVVDILAATGILSAATGIGSGGNDIDTSLGTLDAVNSTSGDISLDETDAIIINRIDQNASTGAVSVVADGTITVAGDGLANNGIGVTAIRGAVTLTANGTASNVAINDEITTLGGSVLIQAGNDVTSAAAGDITTTADTAVTSGSVTIVSAFGGTPANTGNIDLDGTIDTRGATIANSGTSGGLVKLDASTNSGGFVDAATILTAGGDSTAGLTDGGNAGAVDVDADGVITLATVTATGGTSNLGTTGMGGQVTVDAGAAVVVGTLLTNSAFTATGYGGDGGSLTVNAGGTATLTTVNTSGATTGAANSGGNAGSVTVNAGGQIDVTTITADGGSAAGFSTSTGGNAATIRLSNIGSGADVNLHGQLHALGGTGNIGNGTDGLVAVTAGGGIVDLSPTEAANIVAGTSALRATTGIGSSNDIDTVVNTVAFTNTVSGQVNIQNNGALTINSVDGITTSTAVQGGSVIAASPLTISMDVTIGNAVSDSVAANMLFEATGSGAANDDLTITTGATVSLIDADASTLTFTAGDDVILQSDTDPRIETLNNAGHAVIITADTEGNNGDGDRGSISQTGTNVVIVTPDLTLSAFDGIGDDGTTDNALRITVGTLDAVNTGANDIRLIETDAISVDRIDQDANIGVVTLTAGGTITIAAGPSGVAAVSGNVTLTANGAMSDVVINDTIVTQGTSATSGDVIINAGRNVTSTAAGTITTTAAADGIGSGAVDIDAQGLVNLAGDIVTAGFVDTAPANGGNVDIDTVDGAITVDTINAEAFNGGVSGDINLHANGTARDITLNDQLLTSAGGSVRIDATSGIVDGSVDPLANDIFASNVLLRAGTGVGTNTNDIRTVTVGPTLTLAATTDTGGIFVRNAGAIVVDTVAQGTSSITSLSDLTTTTSGDIKLQVNGALTVNGGGDGTGVSAAGAGSVLLENIGPANDIVLSADVLSGTGPITISTNDDLQLNANVDIMTGGGDVQLFAGNGTADVLTGLHMHATSSVVTGGGDAAVRSGGGNVFLSSVNAGAGDVVVSAFLSILDANGAAVNVQADALQLTALNGSIGDNDNANMTPAVNVNAIDTAVNTLSSLAATGIYIQEADDITIDTVGPINIDLVRFGLPNLTQAFGSLSDLITTNNGPIKIVAGATGPTGSITVNEGGINNTGASAHGTGDVLLEARGATSDVILNANVESGTGDVTIIAGDDIDQNADISTATTGTVFLLANNATANAGVAQAIDMADGTSIISGGGDVLLRALGDGHIGLGLINAGAGNVRVEAQGSIFDNNDGTTPDSVNIQSAGLALVADSDADPGVTETIGTSTNAIETDVSTLAASSDGGVHVDEANGLVIGTVNVTVQQANFNSTQTAVNTSQSGISAADVTLCVNDVLSITQAISVTGTVRIEAAGNITQTAAGTITADSLGVVSTGGSITLDQANDVNVLAARTDSAAATITFNDTDDLTIDFVSEDGCFAEGLGGVTGVSTNAGAIVITANGSLTIDDGLTGTPTAAVGTVNAGTASVMLTSTTGAIIDGSATLTTDVELDVVGGAVTLTAATGIGSDTGVLGDDGDLDIDATTLTVSNSTSGHVQIHEADSVALVTVTNDTRLVVLDAVGQITDSNPGDDTVANITADSLAIRAGTGIGNFNATVAGDEGNDIDIAVANLSATTTTGDLFLDDLDGTLTIAGGAGVGGQSGAVITSSMADGDILIRERAAVAATDEFTVNAVVTNNGSGLITLAAFDTDLKAGDPANASGLTINANITSSGGDVRLFSTGDIDVTTSGTTVATNGGDLLVGGGVGFLFAAPLVAIDPLADVTMASGTVFTTVSGSAGNIFIRTPHDVALAQVNAGTGTVVVRADFDGNSDGAITDNQNDVGDVTVNVIAASLILHAGDGIGTGVAPAETDIDTTVGTLAAVTDSGNIHVQNSTDLTIGSVSSLVFTVNGIPANNVATGTYAGAAVLDDAAAPDSGADSIDIRAAGSLTVDNTGVVELGVTLHEQTVVNADAGNITLSAEGNTTDDDLILDGAVAAIGTSAGNVDDTTGGNIRLFAGDTIHVNFIDAAAPLVNAISTEGTGRVNLLAGSNRFSSLGGSSAGDILMTDGTIISSETGRISLFAANDVALSRLVTSGGQVSVAADARVTLIPDGTAFQFNLSVDGSGEIRDVFSPEGAGGENIVTGPGGSVALRAADGIGSDAEDIDTNAGSLSATTNSGDIHVKNVGNLTITPVALFVDVAPAFELSSLGPTMSIRDSGAGAGVATSGADNITIAATGDLNVFGGVTNFDAGDITLSARGGLLDILNIVRTTNSAATGGGQVFLDGSGGVRLQTAAGDVFTDAGDVIIDAGTETFTMTAGSSITTATATGDVIISADQISLAGAITTPGRFILSTDTLGRDIQIGVGAVNDGTTLGLTQDFLNTITAPTVLIGVSAADLAALFPNEPFDTPEGQFPHLNPPGVNNGANTETDNPFQGATTGTITVVTGGFVADSTFATNLFQLQTTTDVFILGAVDLTANLAGDFNVLAGRDVTQSGAIADVSTAGDGFVQYTAGRLISITDGSITTINGDITLLANDAAMNFGGNFTGITLISADITTGTPGGMGEPGGDILLRGTGGDMGAANNGVALLSGSTVTSLGSGVNAGTITVEGTGGPGTGGGVGIRMSDSDIASADGNILLTGIGQGTGTGNRGVQILNTSTITSTGVGDFAAAVTINGTGAAGSQDNEGVVIDNSTITVDDGDISITGNSNGTTTGNNGVAITGGSLIESQGTGDSAGLILIDGTGGPGTNDNRGVSVVDSRVSSRDGDIELDGRSDGTGSGNVGVLLLNSTVESTGATANAATITIDGAGGPGTDANHGVQMRTTSLVTSEVGAIQITGSSQGTGERNIGVHLEASTVESTGTATILIDGIGGPGTNFNSGVVLELASHVTGVSGDIDILGQSDGTGIFNFGVHIFDASTVESSGTGATAANITIEGAGGPGGDFNSGVVIHDINTRIESVDGAIDITGMSDGTGLANIGVHIHEQAVVESTGASGFAATISIFGVGGPGTDDNYGVLLDTAVVTSEVGAIAITGQGNGTGDFNRGVAIVDGAEVSSTGQDALNGAATITIDGTGGAGVDGNVGVLITGVTTVVTSVDGNVAILGDGGADAATGHSRNHGVEITNRAVVSSTGTLKADAATITIDGTAANSGSATTDGVFNIGVLIQITGTLVTSVAGDISIDGAGGAGTDPFSSGSGVLMSNGADVTSTGTGANAADITITGTGASGVAQANNIGVVVTGAGTRVAAVDGSIDITGTGGLSSGSSNYGVLVAISAVVETTGNDGLAGSTVGDVTITGLGQGTGDDAFGVYILSATVRAVDGDVTVLGTSTSTSATGANGVVMEFGSLVATNNSGKVAITGVAGTSGTRDAVIVENSNVRTNTTQITITGVNDDVRMQGTAAVQSISGDALIQASKDVLLTVVNLDFDAAGAQGTAVITADANTTGVDPVNGQLPDGVGAIIDNLVGETPNIIAAAAALCAGSGIGDADDIDTTVATLAAENTTSGQIQIENTTDLTIGTVSGKVGIGQQAPGALTSIVVHGDLTVTQPITSTGGLITLLADENVTFGPLGDVTSNGGNVVVTADADLTGGAGAGAILMQDIAGDSAVINAGSGTVTLTAPNDITLGGVVTTNGTAAAVTITSTEGAIVDGGDSAVEITAEDPGAVVTLTAATGIGDGNALETSLAHLVGTVTGTGDVEINEVSPTGLELQNVTTANGSVTVTSVGTILATLVDTSATQNDTNDVSLTTTGAGADILVTAVNAGAINDVTLTSADDVANTAAAAASSVIADDLIILANNNTADGPAAIELQTEVQDLTANVLAAHQGNIEIVEVNDLNLATADAAGDSRTVSTTNGFITITTGGDLTIVDAAGGNDDATRTSDVEVTAGGALGGILFTVAGDLELQTFAQIDAYSDTVTPIPTAPTMVEEGSAVTTNDPIITAIVQGDVQWGQFSQVRTLQAGTGAVVGVARQIAARPDMGPPPSDGTTAFYDASSIVAPTLSRVGSFFQGTMTVTIGQPGEVNLTILIDWGIDSANRFETITGLVGGETYTFVHNYTETELLDSRIRRGSAADPISVQFGISMEGSMLVLGRSVTTADGLTTAIPDPLVGGTNPGLANLTSTDLLSTLVPDTTDTDGTFVENGQAFFVLPAGVGSGIPNFITQVALPVFERVTSFFGDVVQVTTSIVTTNRQTQLVLQVLGREEYLELRVLSPDPDAAPLAVRRLPDEFLSGKEGASFTDLFNGLPDGTYEIWYVLGGNRRLLVRVEVRNGKAEIQQDELQGGQLKLEEIIDKLRDELAPQSDVTQAAPQWTAPLEAMRTRRPVRLVEDVEPELAEEALAELVIEVLTPATEESASEDAAAELSDTASSPAAETVEQSTVDEALLEAETTDGEQAAAFAPLAAVAALSGSRRLLRGQAANPFSRSRRAARRMVRTGDQAE